MNPKDSAKNDDQNQIEMEIGSETANVDDEFVGDIKSDEMEQEQRPQSNGMQSAMRWPE